jgi:phosphohistidine swiveling domain-containing protein
VAEIVWLSDAHCKNSALSGGKGASLGDLIQLGMPVPHGFVVTTETYGAEAQRWALANTLSPLLAQEDWAGVRAAALAVIRSRPFPESLRLTVLEAYRHMGSPAVAVRSSATAEDLADASFAGQHDSYLNIRGEEALLEAIRRCWASLWSERAVFYRQQRSIEHFSVRMAVLVQQMVPAEAAGVIFTVDPIAHSSDQIYIEAAAGLGERVVSGAIATQVYLVDRATLREARSDGGDTVLDAKLLTELCRLALEVEKHKGCPQDIEFAVAGGKLYVLQARPITSLNKAVPEPLPPLGEPSLIDRLIQPIAAERYVLAPRPLDNIIFTRVVGAVMYAIKQLGGKISPEDEAAFRSQIWRQAYRLPPVHLTAKFLFSQWKYLRLLRMEWQAWWASGPREQLRDECGNVDLAGLGDEQLFERTDRILAVWERVLNERFYVSSAINAKPWLDRIVALVVARRERAQVIADLMSGLRTPTSEVNDALWQLSRLARNDPDVQVAVCDLRPDRLPRTPQGEAFRNALSRFMETYGHREGAGYYLSTPTWRRDPMQVWRLLRSLVAVEVRPSDADKVRKRYEAARARVERRLRFLPGIRTLFGWLVDRFRALDTFRETSHFDITQPLAALQEIAGEWSRRLQERGILRADDDVYYLTHKEVIAWLLGVPPAPSEVNNLVARRRATYEQANSRWQRERVASVPTSGKLTGVAASRGVARGRVRVIRSEKDFHLLRPGEVLVCPYSNPAWTPLFISAVAVVSDTGGAASHAAIVAREYGIPAVMAMPGATEVLQQGEEVVVDGDQGVVLRLQPGSRAQAERN